MVDPIRRKQLALNLRHLCVGLITNDEFESNVLDGITSGWLPEHYYRAKKSKTDDQVVIPVLELSWSLYSDLKEHKLIGVYKLTEERLKVIARCILFLQSDREYQWPYFHVNNPLFKMTLGELLLCILTFGQYYRHKKRQQKIAFKDYLNFADYNYWPFLTCKDYQEQLNMPPFLIGKK